MKYRTKLILLFSFLAIFTGVLIVSLTFFSARTHLREQMDATALSIAATTAAFVDVDLHQSIRTTNDQAGAAYQRLEADLRRARNANRRGDVDVKFLFTLRRDPADTNRVVFAVDAEEPGEDKSSVGEVYVFKGPEAVPIPFGEPLTQPGFLKDKWGTWLEAYAPVRDSAGRTIAVVGVDLKASDVVDKMNRLLVSGLIALGISVLLGLGCALMLARLMSQHLDQVSGALDSIGKGDLKTELTINSHDEFADVARSINAMVNGLRQRENLKNSLVRYVSSHVAENILSTGEMPELKGERRKLTVLFSDVRNFTSLSEKLPPEEVVKFLNEYFAKMIDIIFENRGTLDKFMGDGLMAFFGAPLDDPEQEYHAVRAALQMRTALETLQQRWRDSNLPNIRIGVGIHTGPAVVGNIGSQQKMQYTAIGDTVNLAARLEAASKHLAVDIVVSEETRQAVGDVYKFARLDAIQVKGREAGVVVYSVTEK